MICLNNVTVKYGSHVLFSRFSREFSSGSTHIILGPSGCGKTTLLKVMAGLLKVPAKSVYLNQKEISTIQGKDKLKFFGLMFQEGGLLPHLSAQENIMLPGRLIKMGACAMRNKLRELCQMVQLETQHLAKYPKQLSGGQKQRVSLMRSLMVDAPIILMDEPLNALDPLVRQALLVDLKKIFKQLRKTVVFVTHNLSEAAYLGDRIYLMQKGAVVQEGSFDEIYHRPQSEFVKKFITAQVPVHG